VQKRPTRDKKGNEIFAAVFEFELNKPRKISNSYTGIYKPNRKKARKAKEI
jgi:hypothetical protein